MPQFDKSLVWFRRDLRHTDHAALYYALSQSQSVWCVFVFDTDILDALKAEGVAQDRRVDFLLASVAELDEALRKAGGGLIVLHGAAARCIPELAAELAVQAVFVNTDYEPAAVERDAAVDKALNDRHSHQNNGFVTLVYGHLAPTADGLIFACPENLAAMSGLMKEFFDRTYYEVIDRAPGRPYAIMVCGGSDGEGAVRQITRIATGWRLRAVADPVIVSTRAQTPEAIMAEKVLSETELAPCAELGQALAAGLALGVF